jgi:hypothetical protein
VHTRAADVETQLLVDARNVLRSQWPNMAADAVVVRSVAWARRAGVVPVVVFDGSAPGGVVGVTGLDAGGVLVGTGGESADDWIARAAADQARAGRPYWLVTSDRGLRGRAGGGAARTIGGGTFVRELARLDVDAGGA